LVKQISGGKTKQRRRTTRTPASPDNLSSDREPSHKGFDPWTDHDGSFVVDENYVDATIWEHAMRVFAMATGDRLRPEAQEMVRQ